jgi:hypothetical protein
MKKLIWITTILLVALCAFTSCTQEPSQGADGEMTESYADSRAEFKKVTGIELPAIDNLEVDREYPYKEGDTDYCFDIIGGSALVYQTYLDLQTFLNGKLGTQVEGFPHGNETVGSGSAWVVGTRQYTLDWYKLDNGSFMIFLNTWVVSE